MIKNIVISGAVVLGLSGCAGPMVQLAQSQMSAGIASSAPAGGASQLGKVCIPRMGGGSVSTMDMATKFILNPLIESAIKDATGEDVKMPPKLLNNCEADKGLQYVKDITNQFYVNVAEIDKKILEALEENDVIIKLKTELADMLAMEDKADQTEGLAKIHEKIEKEIENASNVDSKKISEASGIAAKTVSLYIPLIIGWNKEIAEYSKDNIVWAVKNVGEVKTLFSQITTLVGFAKNGFSGLNKLITNNDIKINQKYADSAAKNVKGPSKAEVSQAASEI